MTMNMSKWGLNIITRRGVAGAVLKTPLSLFQRVTNSFPPNLQNTKR